MIKPKKSFSQNFVVNPSLIKDVVLRIEKSYSSVEVGSGLGTLSYFLSRTIKNLKVFFELDQKLAEISSRLIEDGLVINSDALRHEWRFNQVVSTVPYHLTNNIMVKIARSNDVKRAVLVLQREVVDRLKAAPGTRDYGRLTILTNSLFDIETGPTYPPSFFYPQPEVHSRLVVLLRKRRYDEITSLLEEVTRRVFSEKRKKIGKVFPSRLGLDEGELKRLGIDPGRRVYELSVDELLRIVEVLR